MCIRDRFIKGLVSVPFLGSIHPQITPVSYTHLDVYKRQQITHEAGKQEGDNGTKNGVERNPFIPVSYTHLDVYKRQPFIHIAAIFHSVPQPFKFRQYAF